jgi:hypothetical protein
MKASTLTTLILQINSAIDSGKYQSISISDVHGAIKNRSLLKFLKISCKDSLDLSCHLSDAMGGFEAFYEDAIGRIYDGYAGDERRKWGVQNQGLCLVLAWTNEIIQQAFMDVDLPN